MSYWASRSGFPYYALVRRVLEALGPQDSLLDVGPADTPCATWGDFQRRYTIEPQAAAGAVRGPADSRMLAPGVVADPYARVRGTVLAGPGARALSVDVRRRVVSRGIGGCGRLGAVGLAARRAVPPTPPDRRGDTPRMDGQDARHAAGGPAGVAGGGDVRRLPAALTDLSGVVGYSIGRARQTIRITPSPLRVPPPARPLDAWARLFWWGAAMVAKRGVSIIEVLFGIAIAAIGMLSAIAVLVVAGHRVTQATVSDASVVVGRRAEADWRIRGWDDPDSWRN